MRSWLGLVDPAQLRRELDDGAAPARAAGRARRRPAAGRRLALVRVRAARRRARAGAARARRHARAPGSWPGSSTTPKHGRRAARTCSPSCSASRSSSWCPSLTANWGSAARSPIRRAGCGRRRSARSISPSATASASSWSRTLRLSARSAPWPTRLDRRARPRGPAARRMRARRRLGRARARRCRSRLRSTWTLPGIRIVRLLQARTGVAVSTTAMTPGLLNGAPHQLELTDWDRDQLTRLTGTPVPWRPCALRSRAPAARSNRKSFSAHCSTS